MYTCLKQAFFQNYESSQNKCYVRNHELSHKPGNSTLKSNSHVSHSASHTHGKNSESKYVLNIL